MIFEEDKAFARAMLGDEVVNAAEENAVLMHEGVKGMKWGIWNAETRARRLRERGLKKARRAKLKKAKLEKKAKKQAEKEREKLDYMNDKELYKYAQKEFKKKVNDVYRNIKDLSIEDLSKIQDQVDKASKLIEISTKPKKPEGVVKKATNAANSLADLSKPLGILGDNLPKIKKGLEIIMEMSGKKSATPNA